jgi:uncharacterized protein (DUF4415 family)
MKPASNKKSRTIIYRRRPGDPLTAAQLENLADLASRPNRKIDTSDIPELSAAAWKNAIRGRFYRPIKQAVSLRLDADIVAWLKQSGPGYQTRANQILRHHMLKDLQQR